MNRLRALLLLAFTVLGSIALFVSRSGAAPELVRLIAPGVWLREGDFDQGHCNNVIIEMKDYLIVVDANFPSGARGAMADAKRISSKPVKYVFDTHHHGDHLYGNSVWTQAGATTLAFKGVGEELKRLEPARWLDTAKNRKDVAELNLGGPEPPKQDINETIHVLNDGSRKVEFRHYGWAHTRGDGFVYLPKEQVLCTGDAVVNGPYNFTGDANIGNWPLVLRAADKLKVKHVLPGHGPAGGREVLTGQAQFFAELHKAVKAGIDQGKRVEDLQSTVKIPDSLSTWVSERSLKGQIKDAFDEISQGKPRGELTQSR
jgi:glyoxylase-like metal-dependent hydrolase (beta-lactamase superfamily II)